MCPIRFPRLQVLSLGAGKTEPLGVRAMSESAKIVWDKAVYEMATEAEASFVETAHLLASFGAPWIDPEAAMFRLCPTFPAMPARACTSEYALDAMYAAGRDYIREQAQLEVAQVVADKFAKSIETSLSSELLAYESTSSSEASDDDGDDDDGFDSGGEERRFFRERLRASEDEKPSDLPPLPPDDPRRF